MVRVIMSNSLLRETKIEREVRDIGGPSLPVHISVLLHSQVVDIMGTFS